MIKDAKEGKFDYIITKSISRFARNTLDCLTYVRMLKNLDKPVGIIFDKEGINTLDSQSETILVVIASDRMGFGDDDLGRKLMISFIKTLGEMGDDLWRIVLVNNGVKLTIEGSAVLETLQAYETQKISIWVCGTCLTHFDLLNEKQVGETTNMLDIVTAMQLATKVITL